MVFELNQLFFSFFFFNFSLLNMIWVTEIVEVPRRGDVKPF